MPKEKSGGIMLPLLLAVIDIALLVWIGTSYLSSRNEVPTSSVDQPATISQTVREEGPPAPAPTEQPPAPTDAPETEAPESAAQEQPVQPEESSVENYHDPYQYETTEIPTVNDFLWVDEAALNGFLPAGAERMDDFEQVSGGWKCYITDLPYGPVGMERYLNASLGQGNSGEYGIALRWHTAFNPNTGERYEENDNDAVFLGSWEYGQLEAVGFGKVSVNDFYYLDGQEYAIGSFMWEDGQLCSLFLVRP